MNIENLRFDLSGDRRSLLRYVHRFNDECEGHLDSCPNACGCHDDLDLDTAIAWEAAECLELIIHAESFRELNRLHDEFIIYSAIAQYHYKKYKFLCDLLFDIEEKTKKLLTTLRCKK